MQFTSCYHSNLGDIFLACDATGLTGLWFYGQKYFDLSLYKDYEERDLPVFVETKRWLDLYFAGTEPDFTPPLHLIGTDFQKEVWDIISKIPYGHTAAYSDIAQELSVKRGKEHMSAQAVGGSVSHNPIALIVPCHRVIMKNGSLGGYAGGEAKKEALLRLEKDHVQQILYK